MPLAAVITSAEIADCMSKEYFNTFGGGPVCTAAGFAMLQVLEDEGLQQRALRVGNYWRKQLDILIDEQRLVKEGISGRNSKSKAETVGSGSDFFAQHGQRNIFVHAHRGSGLFLGIEFRTLDNTPATKETSALCLELVVDYKILSSIDGPHDSVLNCKPPLCFNEENVDEVVGAMRKIFKTKPKDGVGHTPT